jgi:hypothetical protein
MAVIIVIALVVAVIGLIGLRQRAADGLPLWDYGARDVPRAPEWARVIGTTAVLAAFAVAPDDFHRLWLVPAASLVLFGTLAVAELRTFRTPTIRITEARRIRTAAFGGLAIAGVLLAFGGSHHGAGIAGLSVLVVLLTALQVAASRARRRATPA